VQYESIDISPESIHANVLWLKICQFKWVELFKIMGIDPLFITYEQLCSEPIATIKNIGSFLGFTASKDYMVSAKYTQQSQSYPIRFRQAYDLLINE
jgi:LPS sulfotransferase NodH